MLIAYTRGGTFRLSFRILHIISHWLSISRVISLSIYEEYNKGKEADVK